MKGVLTCWRLCEIGQLTFNAIIGPKMSFGFTTGIEFVINVHFDVGGIFG